MESGLKPVSVDDFEIILTKIWERACGKEMGEELVMGPLHRL